MAWVSLKGKNNWFPGSRSLIPWHFGSYMACWYYSDTLCESSRYSYKRVIRKDERVLHHVIWPHYVLNRHLPPRPSWNVHLSPHRWVDFGVLQRLCNCLRQRFVGVFWGGSRAVASASFFSETINASYCNEHSNTSLACRMEFCFVKLPLQWSHKY